MTVSLKSISIVGLLILGSFLPLIIPNSVQNKLHTHIKTCNSAIFLKSGSPIEIYSDNDFLSFSFPGNGSKENPYRIEFLEVITSSNYGIRIENVSKSFIIQDCRVSASFRAIRVFNCKSDSIILSNNICTGEEIGIFVAKAQFIKLINNTCLGSYDGININDSPNSIIAYNTLISNHNGIRVELNISFSKIINNYCFNNYNGIYIMNTWNLLIKNNIIYNNVNGLLLSSTNAEYASQNCVIITNLFDNNTSYAILLSAFMDQDFTRNNRIYHNTFINNNKNSGSQAKDIGQSNLWYNVSLKEGNYWSDWSGFGLYFIDGSVNSIDLYPLENPLHKTYTSPPIMFIGRLYLIIGVGTVIIISIILVLLYIKLRKPKVKRNLTI